MFDFCPIPFAIFFFTPRDVRAEWVWPPEGAFTEIIIRGRDAERVDMIKTRYGGDGSMAEVKSDAHSANDEPSYSHAARSDAHYREGGC